MRRQAELALLRTKTAPADLDFCELPSPAFIIDERLLRANLELLNAIEAAAGVKILLAQKAYSLFNTYPLIGRYLSGAAASGYQEARLAYEFMQKEVQVFSPAFSSGELEATLPYADKLIFNRLRQVEQHYELLTAEMRRRYSEDLPPLKIGLRLNPEYSEVETDLYNPAAPGSRLGTTAALLAADRAELEARDPLRAEAVLDLITGLHVHCLCEEDFPPLRAVVDQLVERFKPYLERANWVNLGGGHHLTRADYQLAELIPFLREFKARYDLEDLYLEPGEAICYDAGWLNCRVLDLQPNQVENAILDVSATCHTPDVLEMPYRPRLFLARRGGEQLVAGDPAELRYSYRLGGPSCLAGDIFGDYSFPVELEPGDQLVFCDMALYTHVKTTMFNGMWHPDLVLYRGEGRGFCHLKRFTFADFVTRLGDDSLTLTF